MYSYFATFHDAENSQVDVSTKISIRYFKKYYDLGDNEE